MFGCLAQGSPSPTLMQQDDSLECLALVIVMEDKGRGTGLARLKEEPPLDRLPFCCHARLRTAKGAWMRANDRERSP